MKRAVNLTYKNRGDDLFQDRLFSYLNDQLSISINDLQPIRKQVYLVKTDQFDFILKGFSTYRRLMLQETFTSALYQVGFDDTYYFYQLSKKTPLLFEETYYGCLQYIEPATNGFTYHEKKDRIDGLDLLSKYHLTTEKLIDRFRILISPFQQIEKWHERAALFFNNLHIVKYFVQKEMIDEYLLWADWSLKGMQSLSHIFDNGEKVITHGDVAHHNFLRGKDNKLYLIDFDLISLSTPHTDYLQYANRILPSINWSWQELSTYEKMMPFLKDKGFIYALAYPTDIFREWNRAIKEKSYLQQEKIQQLLELTVEQFEKRQEFFKELTTLMKRF